MLHTLGLLKSRTLVLLSGEGTTIPAAEARALFLAYDPDSQFESPEPRVLIADSQADPLRVESRIAFARRVGRLVEDRSQLADYLNGRRMRFRCFNLGRGPRPEPGDYLDGLRVEVDLEAPECELTLVRGERDYAAVTMPGRMVQGWSGRRPRLRPFFHPSAIFPKFSRALVNLSRCKEGDVFLDPFSGTGSILLEAYLVGATVVAMDVSEQMVRGGKRNMEHFCQEWAGTVRADSTFPPVRGIGASATDIPYGRASSTRGKRPEEILRLLLGPMSEAMVPRSLLVLMHPQSVPVPRSAGFSLVEEHHLHVHKLLTRTVTVLERR